MNFVDAIASGRPIRREGKASHVGSNGTGWVDPCLLLGCCSGRSLIDFNGCTCVRLTREDVLSTDWEVLPK